MFGGSGRGGERDEGIQSPVVPSRQLSASRPRRLSAEGDVGVLGDKQSVEAALFDRSGQGSRRDPFISHECRDAELHAFIEPYESYREDRADTRFLVGFQSFEVQGHRIWAEEDLRKKVTEA